MTEKLWTVIYKGFVHYVYAETYNEAVKILRESYNN